MRVDTQWVLAAEQLNEIRRLLLMRGLAAIDRRVALYSREMAFLAKRAVQAGMLGRSATRIGNDFPKLYVVDVAQEVVATEPPEARHSDAYPAHLER